MAFEHSSEDTHGLTLLRLSGRLDKDAAETLSGQLDLADAPILLVDLKELVYLSSAGIQTLLSAAQKRQGAGRIFGLSSVRAELRQVMLEAGYGDTLKMFSDLPSALADLGQAPSNPLSDHAARLLGAASGERTQVPAEIHDLAQHAAALLSKPPDPAPAAAPSARSPLKGTVLNQSAIPPVAGLDEPQPPPLPIESVTPAADGVMGRLKGMFKR